VLYDYRQRGSTAYHKLGETPNAISEWDLGERDGVYVRARLRDKKDRVHQPGLEQYFGPERPVDDATATADLTWPDPEVTQDGPALTIKPGFPAGIDPNDFDIEVAQSNDGDAAADGYYVGIFRPDEVIRTDAWPDEATNQIHVRPIRHHDNCCGDWATYDVPVPQATVEHATGHDTDFAAGTIATLAGGFAPLEVSGGDLRFVARYSGDATDVYAGDATDVYAADAGLYWGPATYTSANVTLDQAQDIQFQFQPVLTSATRATLYAGDWTCCPCSWPRQQSDATAWDSRPIENNLLNGADAVPLRMDLKVATSTTASATFNDADFKTHTPGKVHKGIKEYAARWIIYTYFDRRPIFDKLICRHWRWCRGRPWHSHAHTKELIHEETLTAAVETYDIAGLLGNDWDEWELEVLWKNAVAPPPAVSLWVRLNNDAGANYDDGGAQNEIVVGASTLAQNEWEHAILRIHPASGVERRCLVLTNAQWSSTTATDPGAADAWLWTDNSNEITSIRVLTSGSGSNFFAVGSIFRLWGKWHHEA
jgi:hypothetical protein